VNHKKRSAAGGNQRRDEESNGQNLTSSRRKVNQIEALRLLQRPFGAVFWWIEQRISALQDHE
jgi:hypothetical protein